MLTWMLTYTKQKVDLVSPVPDAIKIEDIAHALAHICRFNGHCPEHYSVAQHSVYVAQMVPPDLALPALLHDAAEAYIGDMVAPLKQQMRDIHAVEDRIARAIERRFSVFIHPMAPEVKTADLDLLVMEARSLLGVDAVKDWGIPRPARTFPIYPWPAEIAERHFLEAFYRLTKDYEEFKYPAALMRSGASFT
jgi:uncharacterized protein